MSFTFFSTFEVLKGSNEVPFNISALPFRVGKRAFSIYLPVFLRGRPGKRWLKSL
jgi:hypothetical protein